MTYIHIYLLLKIEIAYQKSCYNSNFENYRIVNIHCTNHPLAKLLNVFFFTFLLHKLIASNSSFNFSFFYCSSTVLQLSPFSPHLSPLSHPSLPPNSWCWVSSYQLQASKAQCQHSTPISASLDQIKNELKCTEVIQMQTTYIPYKLLASRETTRRCKKKTSLNFYHRLSKYWSTVYPSIEKFSKAAA